MNSVLFANSASDANPLPNLAGELLGAFADALVQLWPVLLLLLGFVVLVGFFRSPFTKGRLGEAAVQIGALRSLKKDGYRVFDDLVLPRPDGKGTTQIDHVVASSAGIFVVETKNYAGRIYGLAGSKYWTQYLRRKKYRFQNPLHQNALHVNALVAATGIPKDRFKSVVYFVGEAVFESELPPEVIRSGLASYVRRHTERLVSEDELAKLAAVLESCLAQRAEAGPAHRRQMRDRRRS